MDEEKTITWLNHPHDSFFREVWSNLDNVRRFLQDHLPGRILSLMELGSLEICKDSFIEKDLQDYFSDMLYKVTLSGSPGYLYVLFEHKSYGDKYVHLQLLKYMVKRWTRTPDCNIWRPFCAIFSAHLTASLRKK